MLPHKPRCLLVVRVVEQRQPRLERNLSLRRALPFPSNPWRHHRAHVRRSARKLTLGTKLPMVEKSCAYLGVPQPDVP